MCQFPVFEYLLSIICQALFQVVDVASNNVSERVLKRDEEEFGRKEASVCLYYNLYVEI